MKTIKFNLCKYTITITIAKKKYKTPALVVEQEQYTSTVNKPVTYYVPVSEALRPHTINMQYASTANEPAEEFKMEDLRSVEECFTEYIESQRGILSPATIKGYANVRDKHLDRIMVCYISRLDEAVIQKAFDEEIAKGYSEKTIKGYKTLLMKVLAVYRPDLNPEIRIKKEAADENA